MNYPQRQAPCQTSSLRLVEIKGGQQQHGPFSFPLMDTTAQRNNEMNRKGPIRAADRATASTYSPSSQSSAIDRGLAPSIQLLRRIAASCAAHDEWQSKKSNYLLLTTQLLRTVRQHIIAISTGNDKTPATVQAAASLVVPRVDMCVLPATSGMHLLPLHIAVMMVPVWTDALQSDLSNHHATQCLLHALVVFSADLCQSSVTKLKQVLAFVEGTTSTPLGMLALRLRSLPHQ